MWGSNYWMEGKENEEKAERGEMAKKFGRQIFQKSSNFFLSSLSSPHIRSLLRECVRGFGAGGRT